MIHTVFIHTVTSLIFLPFTPFTVSGYRISYKPRFGKTNEITGLKTVKRNRIGLSIEKAHNERMIACLLCVITLSRQCLHTCP